MNKIISELLSPSQTRPEILAQVLFQVSYNWIFTINCLSFDLRFFKVFETLREKETPFVVCDWALLSLPSFTNKIPVEFAVWSLTGFLLSACTNGWVRNLWVKRHFFQIHSYFLVPFSFPVNLGRRGRSELFDQELFSFAVGSFRAQVKIIYVWKGHVQSGVLVCICS